jgi:hypothetical protein
MNEMATDLSVDANTSTATAVERALAELERRVQTLETRVAALPDATKLEEHVTERVKASLPPPPPAYDPTKLPSFKDIALPIPSVQTLVDTAKTTWTLLEMIGELKMLFWMLVDRRYHMAWLTRVITIVLLGAILLSHWWVPLASYDNPVSRIWDKAVDLLIGVLLFMILNFETRRYKEWRSKR